MHSILSLTLLAATVAAAPDGEAPRKPNPIAPSLPLLTEAEEEKLDFIIDQFIRQDTGLLKGEEGKKALRDFHALKPEAIPALIRGLNRAAKIEHSCPVLVIATKLDRMLRSSDDKELLEYARDEIGSDVGKTRHQSILRDLRMHVTFRKNELASRPVPGPKAPRVLTLTELADAASTERGTRLKAVLMELEQRKGPEVLTGLGLAAGSYERETQQLGRDLLDKHLARQGTAFVKDRLQDEQPEVRQAAARAIAAKFPMAGRDLTALLTDEKADVRAAAHDALVKLAKGKDFGPDSPAATAAARAEAQRRWRDWFDRVDR